MSHVTGPKEEPPAHPRAVARPRPRRVALDRPSSIRRPARRPAAVLALGFLVLIALGGTLLTTPLASAAGTWTHPLTAFFTATSAVCVTGLVVVDTADHWSAFGQVVILLLIQAGGLGFMAGSTLIMFLRVTRRTALRDRIVAAETVGVADLGSVRRVVRRIALFAFATEAAGALVLAALFLATGSPPGQAAWFGVFHAVSAFNNAGFDVLGGFTGFTAYNRDGLLLLVLATLVVIGGLGYAIVADLAVTRRWSRLALETRLVVLATAILLVTGTVALAWFEWSNPATLGPMSAADKVANAAFQSAAFRTAGFSSIAVGGMAMQSLFLAIGLMFIGTASGSTGGGIKVNTFAVLLATVVSTVRGREAVEAFGRRLPQAIVARALSVAVLSFSAVFLVGLVLTAQSGLPFTDTLFEATSAVATVGATTGITPALAPPSLVVLALAMFLGRLGPLTVVLALTSREHPRGYAYPVESVRIG
jgi:trk system potassium uptake protein TrkH